METLGREWCPGQCGVDAGSYALVENYESGFWASRHMTEVTNTLIANTYAVGHSAGE